MWWLIERGRAETPAVGHFVRVMWFHGDFLNGGITQVMYNLKEAAKEAIEPYAQSFEELGLAPIATVLRLADKTVSWTENSWEGIFGHEQEYDLKGVYNALAFGLPAEADERFDDLLPKGEDGEPKQVDWVSKAALKYARDHRGEFSKFIEHYKLELEEWTKPKGP
jgi:hypothetical protein